MITVRNISTVPVELGALVLAPGATGTVDEKRPGVAMLVNAKRLAIVEGEALAAQDTAAELAEARRQVVALRAERDALRAERDALAEDVKRLSAMVDALGNSPAKPAEPADTKPSKKGG